MKVFLISTFAMLLAANVFAAASCELSVTRTACKGKEVDSFSKCAGKASCVETIATATTEETCKNAAIVACLNTRTTVTQKKVITAKFTNNGAANNFSNVDFCASDAGYTDADGKAAKYEVSVNFPFSTTDCK